jgi:hypothetical protein
MRARRDMSGELQTRDDDGHKAGRAGLEVRLEAQIALMDDQVGAA